MSATIKELNRRREAGDLLKRSQQANERTGIRALLEAFEAGEAAIASGDNHAVQMARSDVLTARAWAGKLIGSMHATPLRRLLSGFVEISHVWMGAGPTLPEDRRRAAATLKDLAGQIRDMVGEG